MSEPVYITAEGKRMHGDPDCHVILGTPVPKDETVLAGHYAPCQWCLDDGTVGGGWDD